MMIAYAAWLVLASAGTRDGAVPGRVHELPEIVVRSDRVAADVLRPFTVATFGRDEIARRPGAELDELLETVAGVRVASHGLASSSVSIRGSTTDQVVLLVDGRRMSTAQGGGTDATTLSLDAVESVEVIRGGASALWGGDALGGAIHVRLRPARTGYRARLAAGSFGERSAEGDAGVRLGSSWSVRGSARARATNGDFLVEREPGAEQRIENGDLDRVSSELRADGRMGRAGITGEATFFGQDRGVPGSSEFPTPSARLFERRLVAGATVRDLGSAWRKEADVSWMRQTHRYREPLAAFGPIDDEHVNTRGRVELTAGHGRGPRAVEAAVGAVSDRLESTTDGRRQRDGADVRVLATRDVALRGRIVQLLGAARLDAVRGWKGVLSPRAGATLQISRRVRVLGSAGTAFRVPSFDELFWAPRGSAAGNPDLRVERGRDVDFGLSLDGLPLRGTLAATAFLRDVHDLIQWIPGADALWRPHNLGRATLFGVESDASLAWEIERGTSLRVGASGTWMHSEDRTGEPNAHGNELVYRPSGTGAISARLTEERLGEIEATVRATDDVFVTRANTKRLDGYVVADLRWRRSVGAGLRADVSISNLGGAGARDFRDYPLPGRAVSVGLAWEGGGS
jgi:outer membrane cobalamin receptor